MLLAAGNVSYSVALVASGLWWLLVGGLALAYGRGLIPEYGRLGERMGHP